MQAIIKKNIILFLILMHDVDGDVLNAVIDFRARFASRPWVGTRWVDSLGKL